MFKEPEMMRQSKRQSDGNGSGLSLDRHTKPCYILSSSTSCLLSPFYSHSYSLKQPFVTEQLIFRNNAASNAFGTLLYLFRSVERRSLPQLETITNNNITHSCQISNPICSVMGKQQVYRLAVRFGIKCYVNGTPLLRT